MIALVFLFTSCSIKEKQNVKLDLKIDLNNKSVITGEIVNNSKSTKAIYVVLYKHLKGDLADFKNYKLIDFSSHTTLSKEYEFNLVKGTYLLYACQELEVLRDEKYAYEYFSKPIVIDSFMRKGFDIKLNTYPTITKKNNSLISSKNEISLFSKIGSISNTTLSNPIFKRNNSRVGLWNPKEFFLTIGGGLYLLDDYTEKKEIVLFVHGMNGTPRDFKTIIDNIDQEKYLPIVYFYATGMNLNYVVDGLKHSFDKLKELYSINNINIVAHSMGGLVSRAFINEYSEKLRIDKFITIATPWNGQKYAKLGGAMAKSMAQSFGNMIPHSAFIDNNQNIEFPNYLKHYLLFGYKGKRSMVLDYSNDGVISLSSQLYNKAEKKAFMIYGFNESHVSILNSSEPVNFINNILKN